MSFETNWLRWPLDRNRRSFRVYVVEPAEYDPRAHGSIFDAVLVDLISPIQGTFVSADSKTSPIRHRNFDLIVFPEAFLSSEDLVRLLEKISGLEEFGCLHVGLRPNYSDERHLFRVDEIQELLSSLKAISSLEETDLNAFSAWVEKQPKSANFNLGCLLMLDIHRRVRVCLHPKLVRSKFELGALHSDHMTEANLLSLVTLVPKNKRYMTVTLQPMICSDALLLPTEGVRGSPLEAFTDSSAALPDSTPDHIDIVSLSLCTPLQYRRAEGGEIYRQWHSEFRKAFVHAAESDACPRHHFSTFVMSNFGSVPNAQVAGMSGAFMAIPLPEMTYPAYVSLSSYGTADKLSDTTWVSCPDLIGREDENDIPIIGHGRQGGRGYLACVNVSGGGSQKIANVLGFTISRMLRDNPRWAQLPGLADFELRQVDDQKGLSENTEKTTRGEHD